MAHCIAISISIPIPHMHKLANCCNWSSLQCGVRVAK